MGGIDSGATSMLIVAKVSKNQRGDQRVFRGDRRCWFLRARIRMTRLIRLLRDYSFCYRFLGKVGSR